MKIIFSKEAEKDVVEVVQYIAKDSTDVGALVFDKVWDTCQLISSLPKMGVLANTLIDTSETDQQIQEIIHAQSLLKSMRKFPVEKFKNLLLFYTVRNEQLHIERVLHASRDIPNIFSSIN